MKRLFRSALIVVIAGASWPALAAIAEPPSEAMRASEIASTLEKLPGYLYLREMRWNDERGDWSAIYHASNGMDKRVHVDARTGAIEEDGDAFAPGSDDEDVDSGGSGEAPTVQRDDMPPPAGREDDAPATTPGAEEGDTLIPTPNGMK